MDTYLQLLESREHNISENALERIVHKIKVTLEKLIQSPVKEFSLSEVIATHKKKLGYINSRKSTLSTYLESQVIGEGISAIIVEENNDSVVKIPKSKKEAERLIRHAELLQVLCLEIEKLEETLVYVPQAELIFNGEIPLLRMKKSHGKTMGNIYMQELIQKSSGLDLSQINLWNELNEYQLYNTLFLGAGIKKYIRDHIEFSIYPLVLDFAFEENQINKETYDVIKSNYDNYKDRNCQTEIKEIIYSLISTEYDEFLKRRGKSKMLATLGMISRYFGNEKAVHIEEFIKKVSTNNLLLNDLHWNNFIAENGGDRFALIDPFF